eukprot:scaffold98034_cov63-Phaeocystis_antarctica.AAC.8
MRQEAIGITFLILIDFDEWEELNHVYIRLQLRELSLPELLCGARGRALATLPVPYDTARSANDLPKPSSPISISTGPRAPPPGARRATAAARRRDGAVRCRHRCRGGVSPDTKTRCALGQ